MLIYENFFAEESAISRKYHSSHTIIQYLNANRKDWWSSLARDWCQDEKKHCML